MDELKLCPFCGSEPDIVTWKAAKVNPLHLEDLTMIRCIYPKCINPSTAFKPKDEAVKAWNRRADNGLD